MKFVLVKTLNSFEIVFGHTITRDAVQKTLDYIEKELKCSLRTCIVDDGDSFNLLIDDAGLNLVRVSSVFLKYRKKRFIFNSQLICILRSLIYYSDASFYFAFDMFRKRYLPSRTPTRTPTEYFQQLIARRYLKDVFNFLYVHRTKWNGNCNVFKILLGSLTKFFSIRTKNELRELSHIFNLNLFKRFLHFGEGFPMDSRHRMMDTGKNSISECYNAEMDFVCKRKRSSESMLKVMESAQTYYRSMLGPDKTKIDRDEERAAMGLLIFLDNVHNMQTSSYVGKTKMFHYLTNIIKNKRLEHLSFVQLLEDKKSIVVEDKMFPILN